MVMPLLFVNVKVLLIAKMEYVYCVDSKASTVVHPMVPTVIFYFYGMCVSFESVEKS